MIQNDIEVFYKGCSSCYSKYHEVDECPLIHFIPDRERIIKKWIFSIDQQRQTFIRNRGRTINPKIMNSNIIKK